MADQVDEIKTKTDIVKVVGEHVKLRKAGRNFLGLCPFHSEKTPSFTVTPELQIFKCFGCGKGGDVFTFLQEIDGMEFYEALKLLADRAGVELKASSRAHRGEKDRLYDLNELVKKFYHYVLTKHALGKKALVYLTENRGVSVETIKIFELGYSPENSQLLVNFVKKKGFTEEELVASGTLYKGRGVFDRFRGRVIFPLIDHRGNTTGFAGRIMDPKAKLAKYINSPETILYHKSSMLFALNLSRKEIKKEGFVVLVEGELDAISPWQAGIKNVAAIKGSALTAEQIRLVSRFTKRIVFALDADAAGTEAAKKGIKAAYGEGFDIRVARLGEYSDPDDFARSDAAGFRESIENAVNAWDFLIEEAVKGLDLSKGENKAKASRTLVPVLALIEDKIVQSHYVSLVAKMLSVPPEAVQSQVDGVVREIVPEPIKEKKTYSRRELLERRLLAISLSIAPEFLSEKSTRKFIRTPFSARILEEYLDFDGKFSLQKFSDGLPEELKEGFADMIMSEPEERSKQKAKKELARVVINIEALDIRAKLANLSGKIAELEEKGEVKKLRLTQEEFGVLTSKLSALQH